MLRPGKDKGLATPIPLGLAGLATTTFLVGVAAILPSPAARTPILEQALVFGGLAEFLAGMWGFVYGDPLAATAFSFLGVFNLWWGFTHIALPGLGVAFMASGTSAGLIMIVTAVVVLGFWIASFFESAAFNLTLLFLWLAYALIGIDAFINVTSLLVLGGMAAVISGLIGAYASFAELYNATALREAMPLGEPHSMRERSEQDEAERIRRLHPTNNVQHPSQLHA